MENILKDWRHWAEPAHPMVVKLHRDLIEIYRFIKENYQENIDEAFDIASKKVGLVLTTTMPITIEIDDNGSVKDLKIGSDKLGETILVKELSKTINADKINSSAEIPKVSSGVYNLAVFWFDAVKLSLRTDWMEPAQPVYQFKSQLLGKEAQIKRTEATREYVEPPYFPCRYVCRWERVCKYECRPYGEPAHPPTSYQPETAYEPQTQMPEKELKLNKTAVRKIYEPNEPVQINLKGMLDMERSVLISAIDEVYPELKLGKRLTKAQYAMSPVVPIPPPKQRQILHDVQEPVQEVGMADYAKFQPPKYQYQQELIPGVIEPAHLKVIPPEELHEILAKLASVLKTYGY